MNATMDTKAQLIGVVAIFACFAVFVAIIFHLNNKQEANQATYFTPGVALYNKGDYKDAESNFRQVFARAPNGDFFNCETHYYLGMCLLQEGRRDEATNEFETASNLGNGSKGGGDDPCKSKAEAALAWLNQNPNWQPAADGQVSGNGPPQDFPTSRPINQP